MGVRPPRIRTATAFLCKSVVGAHDLHSQPYAPPDHSRATRNGMHGVEVMKLVYHLAALDTAHHCLAVQPAAPQPATAQPTASL